MVRNDVDNVNGFTDFVIGTGGIRVTGITYTDGTNTVTIAP